MQNADANANRPCEFPQDEEGGPNTGTRPGRALKTTKTSISKHMQDMTAEMDRFWILGPGVLGVKSHSSQASGFIPLESQSQFQSRLPIRTVRLHPTSIYPALHSRAAGRLQRVPRAAPGGWTYRVKWHHCSFSTQTAKAVLVLVPAGGWPGVKVARQGDELAKYGVAHGGIDAKRNMSSSLSQGAA